jgi:CRISPR-associated protein Cmr4
VPKLAGGRAAVVEGSVLPIKDNDLVIDDLDLKAQNSEEAKAWAQHCRRVLFPGDAEAEAHFDTRFLVLADDEFGFLCETGTEVRARIRINDATGTVDRGALWYEENLPAESVLWGVIGVGPARERNDGRDAGAMATALRTLVGQDRSLQLGGKASVGRGLVRFRLGGE